MREGLIYTGGILGPRKLGPIGSRWGAVQSAGTGCGGGRYKGAIRVDCRYCVVWACLLSLSLCKRGFHDLLRDKPSSLFMLCGCISISIASLINKVVQTGN